MTIDDMLQELGRQMGVPLALDRNRACRLVFDERFTIDIEAPAEQPGTVFAYGVVGRVPASADAAFFRMLLEANLFGRDTEAATLAVDGLRSDILLQRILAIETMEFAAFVQVVESLIRAIAAWSERLATIGHKSPAGDAGSLPSGIIRA